jgi:hypothetical protein
MTAASVQLLAPSERSYPHWKLVTGNWKLPPTAPCTLRVHLRSLAQAPAELNVWSEKTTVCRIFSCKRTLLEALSCQPSAVNRRRAAYATSFSPELSREYRPGASPLDQPSHYTTRPTLRSSRSINPSVRGVRERCKPSRRHEPAASRGVGPPPSSKRGAFANLKQWWRIPGSNR